MIALMLSFFGESIVVSIKSRIKVPSITNQFYPVLLIVSSLAGFGLFFGGFIKSNTEKFWRQYDYAYYTGSQFDYFTYEGRRMGAHSGLLDVGEE